MSLNWLEEKAPGFAGLSDNEREAIVVFPLLWSLFEAQLLNSAGNANRIKQVVDKWDQEGALDACKFTEELSYFRERYFEDGNFTYHFNQLWLRANDKPALVRSVINGSNNTPQDIVTAVFIIIMRFRNNLFHGVKWQYELIGQLENFTHSNNVLMKVLEQYGQLNVS